MTTTTPPDERTRSAVDWLLSSSEPAIRAMARTDLRDEPPGETDDAVLAGPMVDALLGSDDPGAVLALHPYTKWVGAHWRLVSLVELRVPAGDPRLGPMVDHVLDWLTGRDRLGCMTVVACRARPHASQEGNALAVCCRLGLAGDERVAALAEALVRWQWPDGGWNCDRRPEAEHSSFHESHPAIWGLQEYATPTGDPGAAVAARRGAELLLSRRVIFRRGDGEVVNKAWAALHYPPYWHYDLLQGLLVLARTGMAGDPRAGDALDVLERRRLPDGRWRPGGYWWQPPGSSRAREVVDWGRSRPSEMITLNALRVLRAAGRIP